MQDLLRTYQNAVTGEIARLQGHVAKLMGDGVLAYFGWPTAHEDEAERAIRAGLAIVAAVPQIRAPAGRPLACRIGIATGLVVVGTLIGEGAAREEAVVGAAPHLAARLQAIAGPGEVVIAPVTRRLIGRVFELEPLAPRRLKGIAGPVAAFRVVAEGAAESRFAAQHGDVLSRLIGREEELALLLGRWQRARSGEGQVLLLQGEPGIGKSRLVEALREMTRENGRYCLRYQASPHHRNSALWPVAKQLERAAGIGRDDPTPSRCLKLEALLGRAVADCPQRRHIWRHFSLSTDREASMRTT